MRQSRRNGVNPSGNNEHSYDWDLNEPEFQKRLENYLLHGVPGSDARGHSIKLEARFSPVQSHIIEGLKAKVPSNYWRTTSDAVRSLLSLGCCVATKMLANPNQNIAEVFKAIDLLNMVSKAKDELTLYGEVQKCIYDYNTNLPTDMKEKVTELEQLLKKRGKMSG